VIASRAEAAPRAEQTRAKTPRRERGGPCSGLGLGRRAGSAAGHWTSLGFASLRARFARAARSLRSLAVAAFAVAACSTPAPPPAGSVLEPLPSAAARVPEDVDLAARDVAAAALGGPRLLAEAQLVRLEALERERRARGELPSGLVPLATDAVNATLDDPLAYRSASAVLLASDDLEEALRHRLEQVVEDDPLRLADARLRDARVESVAEVFNALIAPISRSVTAGVRGGWGLFRSLLNLALNEHLEDELEFRERQALAHWKRFLDAHPDAPEAEAIALRTEDTQRRWNRTRRDRALRGARRALEREEYAVALVLAQRAERYVREDGEALELREKAAAGLQRVRAERARSLGADPATAALDADSAARELALALLAPGSDLAGVAGGVLAAAPEGPLADDARFAQAIALRESNVEDAEDASWELLEDLSDTDPDRARAARHAAALVESPHENPWRAFRRARRSDRLEQTRWIFFGPLANGPRDLDLPRPVEWLADFPGFLEMLISFPNRLIRFPWLEPWPFGRESAAHARRYLARQPEGAHAESAARWLEGFEKKRGNWVAAFEVAEASGRDPGALAKLRAKAADQAYEGALRQTRRDLRVDGLRHVSRAFQGTPGAARAAETARRELEQATAQRIRISRQFLLENPVVAGSEGLGLRADLLDGQNGNGELHPDGVVLTGGRELEFQLLAASGKASEAPAVQRHTVSKERLARLVALLDETATRNYVEDPSDVLGADADRDLFFERARLGVADAPDRRPSAHSTYAFIGMRERYGLVRGRESILPFEIVVQGSLPDVSLGVFPRMRMPRPTPDAVLYR
jgi:hypothetical protein